MRWGGSYMYLRMLKKDLKEKIGLNIVLFIFMIMATMFTAIGFVMLYTTIYGANITYDRCNTSDLMATINVPVDEPDSNRERIEAFLRNIPEYESNTHREVVLMDTYRVDFANVEDKDIMQLSYTTFILTDMPKEMNIPYDMEDKPFYVESGNIAISQHMSYYTDTAIGDKVRITTQMGNIYEFTVSTIYKDPSSETNDFLIVSEADKEVLYAECPLKYDLFEIKLSEIKEKDYAVKLMKYGTDFMAMLEDTDTEITTSKVLFICDEGIINVLVSVVMECVAVFLIAMIFVTINFNLKSAIKREEREIGMMKAVGVYSLSYKALFAVKYIAFAIVGGIIGLPLAIILSKLLINRFSYHIIFPSESSQLAISVLAVVICILFIVGFTFFTLNKMNKITVMDAIHGENRGERFKRLPGFMLNKNKKMNIPLFLAISDILKKIKRYIFLVFAYVCGVCIVILVLQVKDSLCSLEYMQRYWQYGERDYVMKIEEAYMDKLVQKAGKPVDALKLIDDNFAAHNIPAHSVYLEAGEATMHYKDNESLVVMQMGEYDSEDLYYTKGTAPILYNEIAIPAFTAKNEGINIGDTVSIKYEKYADNKINYEKVTEDFIVTGFFEGFGITVPDIFMGKEFSGARLNEVEIFSYEIDCTDEEYDYYFEQMCQLYTEDEISFVHKDDVVNYYMGSWESMFNLMLMVISIVITIVLILLTILYQNIFIEEEVSDIALLKSMGFEVKSIKQWHFLRIFILAGVSIVFAHLLMASFGRLLVCGIAKSVLRITSFEIVVRVFSNFVIVPIAALVVVAVGIIPALAPMRWVQIWRVKNE